MSGRESPSFATRFGLLPPAYVKPYVKRGKSDRIDAEAICEAASRPTMRFVPVKTVEQQSLTALHRCRELLVKNRTMLVNALRAHLAEFGFVAAKGIGKPAGLDQDRQRSPGGGAAGDGACPAFRLYRRDRADSTGKLDDIKKQLRAWHKGNPQSERLETAPGIRLISATALCALVPDPKLFKNGRHFAAWIGLTPRLDGTGGARCGLGAFRKRGTALCAVCSCWARPR